jgi:ABC-type sugar transport system substrate-binding protein
MSLTARLAAALLLVLALAAGCWKVIHNADQRGYQRAKAEDKAAADELTARNRELMRQAELRYVVKRDAQDRFFVTTVKEIRDAAAPLAAYPLGADLVRLLNDARSCALGNSASSCGAHDAVPGP